MQTRSVTLIGLATIACATPHRTFRAGDELPAASRAFDFVVQSGHGDTVNAVQLASNGSFFVSASEDGTLAIWNRRGDVLHRLHGHGRPVTSVSIDPTDRHIASASPAEGTVRIWSVDGRVERVITDFPEAPEVVAFSPDGSTIAVGCGAGWLARVVIGTGATEEKWQSPPYIGKFRTGITSVSTSPEGLIATADGAWVRVWEPGKGVISEWKTVGVQTVAFSPDGLYVAAGSYRAPNDPDGRTVHMFETRGGLMFSEDGHRSAVNAIAWTRDNRFATASGPRARSLRDEDPPSDGESSIIIWSLAPYALERIEAPGAGFMGLAFSADGESLIAAGADHTVHVYGKKRRQTLALKARGGVPLATRFFADGQRFAVARDNGRVEVWTDSGRMALSFVADESPIRVLETDGNRVLTASDSGVVRLFDDKGGALAFLGRVKGRPEAAWFAGQVAYVRSIHDRSRRAKAFALEGEIDDDAPVPSRPPPPSGLEVEMRSDSVDEYVRLQRNGEDVRDLGIRGRPVAFAWHPDGTQLAVALDRTGVDAEHHVEIWRTTGEHVISLAGYVSPITDLAFSPDGSLLLTGSFDRTMRLWKLPSYASFRMLSDESEWLAHAEDGVFDASPSGGRLLAMVSDLNAYAIDQFAHALNRPDLLLQRLDLGEPDMRDYFAHRHRRRLAKAGLTSPPPLDARGLPTVINLEAKPDASATAAEISFRIKAEDDLSRYDIFVDDVPIFGAEGRPASGRNVEGRERIELLEGENKIEVSGTDRQGRESFRALTYATGKSGAPPRLIFVGFGVSKYADPDLTLDFASKDVRDLAAAFRGMQGRFTESLSKTYEDEAVTPAAFAEARKWLEKTARVNDTVVIFIAGHGVHDRDADATYYYLPHGADPRRLSETSVPFSAIESLLVATSARKKLFLMDTCESGETDAMAVVSASGKAQDGLRPRALKRKLRVNEPAAKPRPYLFARDRYIYNDLARRSGAIVFSSSLGGEFSYERNDVSNGLFTESILAGLGGAADDDQDGRVTSGELRRYVQAEVPKLSGGLQHPTVDRDNLHVVLEFPRPATPDHLR